MLTWQDAYGMKLVLTGLGFNIVQNCGKHEGMVPCAVADQSRWCRAGCRGGVLREEKPQGTHHFRGFNASALCFLTAAPLLFDDTESHAIISMLNSSELRPKYPDLESFFFPLPYVSHLPYVLEIQIHV